MCQKRSHNALKRNKIAHPLPETQTRAERNTTYSPNTGKNDQERNTYPPRLPGPPSPDPSPWGPCGQQTSIAASQRFPSKCQNGRQEGLKKPFERKTSKLSKMTTLSTKMFDFESSGGVRICIFWSRTTLQLTCCTEVPQEMQNGNPNTGKNTQERNPNLG